MYEHATDVTFTVVLEHVVSECQDSAMLSKARNPCEFTVKEISNIVDGSEIFDVTMTFHKCLVCTMNVV